ncbi:MAG: hypothetical protein WC233_07465 [Sphaerochaeta sp.]
MLDPETRLVDAHTVARKRQAAVEAELYRNRTARALAAARRAKRRERLFLALSCLAVVLWVVLYAWVAGLL